MSLVRSNVPMMKISMPRRDPETLVFENGSRGVLFTQNDGNLANFNPNYELHYTTIRNDCFSRLQSHELFQQQPTLSQSGLLESNTSWLEVGEPRAADVIEDTKQEIISMKLDDINYDMNVKTIPRSTMQNYDIGVQENTIHEIPISSLTSYGEKIPRRTRGLSVRSTESPSPKSPNRKKDRNSRSPTTDSSTQNGIKNENKTPPRPPNAWILYRKDTLKKLRMDDADMKLPQAQISRLLADKWKAESLEVRKEYEKRADLEKIKHFCLYPNYRYKPGHRQSGGGCGSDSDKGSERSHGNKRHPRNLKRAGTASRTPSPNKQRSQSPSGSGGIIEGIIPVPPLTIPTSPNIVEKSKATENALEALVNGFAAIAARYGVPIDNVMDDLSSPLMNDIQTSQSMPSTPYEREFSSEIEMNSIQFKIDSQTLETNEIETSYKYNDLDFFVQPSSTPALQQDYFAQITNFRSREVNLYSEATSPTESNQSQLDGFSESESYPMPFGFGSFDVQELGLAPTSVPSQFDQPETTVHEAIDSSNSLDPMTTDWSPLPLQYTSSIFQDFKGPEGCLPPLSPELFQRHCTSTPIIVNNDTFGLNLENGSMSLLTQPHYPLQQTMYDVEQDYTRDVIDMSPEEAERRFATIWNN